MKRVLPCKHRSAYQNSPLCDLNRVGFLFGFVFDFFQVFYFLLKSEKAKWYKGHLVIDLNLSIKNVHKKASFWRCIILKKKNNVPIPWMAALCALRRLFSLNALLHISQTSARTCRVPCTRKCALKEITEVLCLLQILHLWIIQYKLINIQYQNKTAKSQAKYRLSKYKAKLSIEITKLTEKFPALNGRARDPRYLCFFSFSHHNTVGSHLVFDAHPCNDIALLEAIWICSHSFHISCQIVSIVSVPPRLLWATFFSFFAPHPNVSGLHLKVSGCIKIKNFSLRIIYKSHLPSDWW